MSKEQISYRQIMKATSLFGGVQVFQIIIQIVRSKFIALLLGPGGMGIAGLLISSTGFIGGLTNFGLGTSAVKDIATANISGNQNSISIKVVVMQRLAWITGTLGLLLTLVFSSLLSQLTFGNRDYTLAFVWISVTLLFTQLSNGQLALLQGMRKLQYLAKANLIGSLLGLFTTVPLYYYWGINGIVPGIIITSFTTLLLTWYFSQKVKIQPVNINRLKTIAEGKSMLQLGFMISLSGIMVAGTAYIVRIFIKNIGGFEQVGLYNAGFTIINTYVGLIFTAMATDFYPRLSAAAQSNQLCKQTINHQAEIALLILAPVLIIFLIFIKWVVIVLYSTKFIAVNEMIYWAALGMFFKASSWSVAFIFLAKGTSKLFFWNELISNAYSLGFSLLGYHLMGLEGLGISFALTYLVYLIQVYFISKIKFEFSFDTAFLKIFIFQFCLALFSFLSVKLFKQHEISIIGIILILVSSWFSFSELDKRLDFKEIILNVKNQFFKGIPTDLKKK